MLSSWCVNMPPCLLSRHCVLSRLDPTLTRLCTITRLAGYDNMGWRVNMPGGRVNTPRPRVNMPEHDNTPRCYDNMGRRVNMPSGRVNRPQRDNMPQPRVNVPQHDNMPRWYDNMGGRVNMPSGRVSAPERVNTGWRRVIVLRLRHVNTRSRPVNPFPATEI